MKSTSSLEFFILLVERILTQMGMEFHQVVGIEMNASAVSDAKRNAKINNIKNCRFVCSKVSFFFCLFLGLV